MTPQISAQVKGLLELAFEHDERRQPVRGPRAHAARLRLSDELTLWGGRFHTPYGYWNTAFHHGAQIQTSIGRPRFLEFEDEGAICRRTRSASGPPAAATALGRVAYDLYVANADRIEAGVLDFQPIGMDDARFSTGFRAGLTPAGGR